MKYSKCCRKFILQMRIWILNWPLLSDLFNLAVIIRAPRIGWYVIYIIYENMVPADNISLFMCFYPQVQTAVSIHTVAAHGPECNATLTCFFPIDFESFRACCLVCVERWVLYCSKWNVRPGEVFVSLSGCCVCHRKLFGLETGFRPMGRQQEVDV